MNRRNRWGRAILSALVNIAFAVVHLRIGLAESSWWYITLSVYYLMLCLMRSLALSLRTRKNDRLVARFTGSLLMVTALPLLGIAILSAVRDTGTRFHIIVMITIALYAFTKITLAIIHLVKVRRCNAPREQALRSLSFADALVSIASLQRSMLVSFEGMTASQCRLFNLLTGSGVCILIFLMGLGLFRGRLIQTKKHRTSLQQ